MLHSLPTVAAPLANCIPFATTTMPASIYSRARQLVSIHTTLEHNNSPSRHGLLASKAAGRHGRPTCKPHHSLAGRLTTAKHRHDNRRPASTTTPRARRLVTRSPSQPPTTTANVTMLNREQNNNSRAHPLPTARRNHAHQHNGSHVYPFAIADHDGDNATSTARTRASMRTSKHRT